ncbi:hypothetical protein [Pseudoclavibacter soli]|uniref:hypothetical protein n=1 Tax=Pseudoclavibacter soli TaxID=452623 RepID=UPI0004817565|nr:hypothetical protein [Pseudoclavibacter soli]
MTQLRLWWHRAMLTILAAATPLIGLAHAADTNTLPAWRWLGSTSKLHSMVSWSDMEQLMGALSRGTIQTWIMGISQGIWACTIGLMKFALVDFDPTTGASSTIDTSTKSLATSVMGSTLIVMAVVIIIFSALWKKRKGVGGSEPWRRVGFAIAVVSILSAFAFTSMTPTKAVGAISNIAQSSVGAIATDLNSNFDNGGSGLSEYYIDRMHEDYNSQEGANAQLDQISRLWEQSQLRAYKRIQFGSNNTIGDDVYAPWLDLITRSDIADIRKYAGWDGDGNNIEWWAPAFLRNQTTLGDSGLEDRALWAWAACYSDNGGINFKVRDVFTPVNSGDKSFRNIYSDGGGNPDSGNTECNKMFLQNIEAGGDFQSEKTQDDTDYIIENSSDQNATAVKAAQILDFGDAIHGKNAATGTMESVSSFIVALVDLVIFGIIFGGVIIFIKIMIMILTAVLVIALVVSLFNRNGPDMLRRYLVQWMTYQFLAAGSSLLLAVLLWATTLVSQAINDTINGWGATLFTQLLQIWVPGISPIVTIVALHMVFKKLLKMPSPFTMDGAAAWATAGGAAPAMVGSGVGSWLGSKAAHAGSSAMSKATGGRLGGKGNALDASNAKSANPTGAGVGASKKGEKPPVEMSNKQAKRLAKAGLDPTAAQEALNFANANKEAKPISSAEKARKALANSALAHPFSALDRRQADRKRFLTAGPGMGTRLKALAGSDDAKMQLSAAADQRKIEKKALTEFRSAQPKPVRESLAALGHATLDGAKSVAHNVGTSVQSGISHVRENPWQAVGVATKVAGAATIGVATGGLGFAAIAGGAYAARKTQRTVSDSHAIAKAQSALDMFEKQKRQTDGMGADKSQIERAQRPVNG